MARLKVKEKVTLKGKEERARIQLEIEALEQKAVYEELLMKEILSMKV